MSEFTGSLTKSTGEKLRSTSIRRSRAEKHWTCLIHALLPPSWTGKRRAGFICQLEVVLGIWWKDGLPGGCDDIVSPFNRYFDAHGEGEEERQIALGRIAHEVNETLKAEVKPFMQGDSEGVSGFYASPVRFLVGNDFHGMGRCRE